MERDPADAPTVAARACMSCGTPLQGRFCHACGERVLEPGDLHLRHYGGELLNAFTFADNKLWRTIRLLLTRPGELSRNWFEGRRVRQMRPLSFFLLLNLLYFLLPTFNTFNTALSSHLHQQVYSPVVQPFATAKRAEDPLLSADAFAAKFNAHGAAIAKLLILSLALGLSLLLLLLHRRPGFPYSLHLTYALEFWSFALIGITGVLGALTLGIEQVSDLADMDLGTVLDDAKLSLLSGVILGTFHTLAERRLYRTPWLGALWRAAVLMLGVMAILTSYRFALFFITLWTM